MNALIYARFVLQGFEKNKIFDLSHPWNRGDYFQPYHLLREILKCSGIEINTADFSGETPPAFDLHLDAQSVDASILWFLLMLETPQVCPANNDPLNWDRYRKVFIWNDELVDGDKFIKINFPNQIHAYPVDEVFNRDRFCSLISSNKSLVIQDERSLYPERVKVIRWFEQFAPQDIDLYGLDWDKPVSRSGLVGKLGNRFWRILSRFVKLSPLASYRGRVAHKSDVLTKTCFSICYENVRVLLGYITKKIFDSIFSGYVPIYWGDNNIGGHISEDCFISRCQFRELAKLVAEVVGYSGKKDFDSSKPDGAPCKLLNMTKLEYFRFTGPKNLSKGLATSYKRYLSEKLVEGC